MNANSRTTRTPPKFREISENEQYFSSVFDQFSQMGADPAQITALYSLLVSKNSQHREIAARFLQNHLGLGGPSDDENIAAHAADLETAQALVESRSLPPTPASISRRYNPSDKDMNRALDEIAPMTARRKGTYADTNSGTTDLSATEPSAPGAKPYVASLHAIELTPEGDRIVRRDSGTRDQVSPWLTGTATGAWADYGFGE